MARCLVGCGSNLGSRRDFLDRALELLRYMPGVHVLGVSRYRDTRPVGGPPGQGSFLNGACVIETDLPPHDVLGMLAAVENTLERSRGERWGPRTVDLDLLLYDGLVLDTDDLTIPHPRMVTRRFVLEPCVEIAPDWVHPRAGCTLQDLLADISTTRPHVAVIGVPGAGAPEVAVAIADATMARLVTAPPDYAPAVAGGACRGGAAGSCLEALAACARPLAAARWPTDPHGTVADYWLGTIRLAAQEGLAPEARALFESSFRALAAATVPPHVAIRIVAPPAVLEERLASRAARAASGNDTFADLGAWPGADGAASRSAAVVCDFDPVATLLALQDRIRVALEEGQGPRAVVTIETGDLEQAVREAVAAVEAMA